MGVAKEKSLLAREGTASCNDDLMSQIEALEEKNCEQKSQIKALEDENRDLGDELDRLDEVVKKNEQEVDEQIRKKCERHRDEMYGIYRNNYSSEEPEKAVKKHRESLEEIKENKEGLPEQEGEKKESKN